MGRKIREIATSSVEDYMEVVALCEDNTLWHGVQTSRDCTPYWAWEEITPIPEPEEE